MIELVVAVDHLPVAPRSASALQAITRGLFVMRTVHHADAVDDDDLHHPTAITALGLVEPSPDGPVVEQQLNLVPTVPAGSALGLLVASRLEVAEALAQLGCESLQCSADVPLPVHELMELVDRNEVRVKQRFNTLLHGRLSRQRYHQLSM